MDSARRAERVRERSILRKLPYGDVDQLLSSSREVVFEPGQDLLEEGEVRADCLFLVLEGQVAVRMRLGADEQVPLALRGAGDWVGEMALIDDAPRSATLTAQTRVLALRVPRRTFLDIATRHPEAVVDLLRTVARRLRESDLRLIAALRDKNRALSAANGRLEHENRELRGVLDDRFTMESFLGTSRAAEFVRHAGRRAAGSELPVLLVGETGTGKELMARAIHGASCRAQRAFVAVNCALFTETLLESELFGHSRGAFTGASTARPGLVEAADRGTLFLDELCDMPRPIQAALLRFLEHGEYRRIGDTRVRHADVRIVAAAQDELDAAVDQGRLRRDLLYRLDVFRIPLPPLRERREDVPELAHHTIAATAQRLSVEPLGISQDALEVLSEYRYPGNVRELQNEIQRLFASLDSGSAIRVGDLARRFREADPSKTGSYAAAVRAFKKQIIERALETTRGNRASAARSLGVHRSNLVRMIRDLEIEPPGVSEPRAPRETVGAR